MMKYNYFELYKAKDDLFVDNFPHVGFEDKEDTYLLMGNYVEPFRGWPRPRSKSTLGTAARQ